MEIKLSQKALYIKQSPDSLSETLLLGKTMALAIFSENMLIDRRRSDSCISICNLHVLSKSKVRRRLFVDYKLLFFKVIIP
jgi:hypothetical protein